jgi:hypothetical protein
MIKTRNVAYTTRDQGAGDADDGILAVRLIELDATLAALIGGDTVNIFKCKAQDKIVRIVTYLTASDASATIDLGVDGDAAGNGTADPDFLTATAIVLDTAAPTTLTDETVTTIAAHGQITITGAGTWNDTARGTIKVYYLPGSNNNT